MTTKKSKNKRDMPLLVILLIFNFWSGATTIIGAQQILPDSLALICGLAIQIMLFGLLSGWIMKYSTIRKWFAILIFSIASVYTSFFCYYDVLAGDINIRDAFNSAYEQHQQLKANILTPVEQNYIKSKNELKNLEKLAKQECDFGITTGIAGCGPKYRSIKIEIIRKESEVENNKILFKKIQNKFNIDVNKLSPNEIYKHDLEILSLAPKQLKSNFYINESKYNKNIYDVNFLTPFYKTFDESQRETPAVFAFIIAIVVDGIAILQGTAIQKPNDKSIIISFTELIQSIIKEFKALIATIFNEVNKKPSYISSKNFIKKLNKILDNIEYEANGSSYIFLKHFASLLKIGPPHYVSKKIKKYPIIFQNGCNQIFRELILENLCVKTQKKRIELTEEGFLMLTKWLNESINLVSQSQGNDLETNSSTIPSSSKFVRINNREIDSWDSIINRDI